MKENEYSGWIWRCAARVKTGVRCNSIAQPPSERWPWFIPLCDIHQVQLDQHYSDLAGRITALKRAEFASSKRPSIPSHSNARVYFMRRSTDGLIKIGTSRNLAQRRRNIESAAGPIDLLLALPGGHRFERELHTKFAASREHGEWFNPTPDLLEYIADCKVSIS